jgi:rhodanese-related sulfurtransferase
MKKAVLLIGVLALILFIAGAVLASCDEFSMKCFSLGGNEEKIQTVHLSPTAFKKALESGEYKVIDIRTMEEYRAGHLKGSVQKDFFKTEEFSKFLDSLDKTQKYLIYCRSGNRSGKALIQMQEKGFKNVSDLDGGYNVWIGSGYPVEE